MKNPKYMLIKTLPEPINITFNKVYHPGQMFEARGPTRKEKKRWPTEQVAILLEITDESLIGGLNGYPIFKRELDCFVEIT